MKKIISILTILLLMVGITACGGKNEGETNKADNKTNANTSTSSEASDNGDKVFSGKHFIIAMSASFKNFETVAIDENGKEYYEGLDIDLIDKMAEDMGFTYEVLNMSFNGLIGSLQANRADMVVSGMTATDERAKNVDFSDGYMYSREGFLVQKDSGLKSVDDLKGKTISCSVGTSYEDLARKIEGAKVTTFDGQPAVLQELLSGRTDAMVTDGSLVGGFLEEYPELDGFMLPIDSDLNEGVAPEFAIAFPKGSELVGEFNKEIKTLIDNGTMEEIIIKWLGEAYIGD
ncbi:transporter substrate-binding domain-containing protein [Peptoniphilus catoniae]|uniref:transporter substrate-binding domain-containing protein n=1 Tax=Peptoniphilus catoniae TaxID=1660341 RepID=UPI0010FEDD3F|nr:transporter substrate-binding domain-containing protein [Peptoniphilus catoniae]